MNVANSAMAYLRLQDIEKQYGATTALRTSLAFEQGKFTCVLGPSGCGKTTLLQLIAGISPPTRGHIFLQGQDITYTPPQQRKIGMVFQQYALFPNLTVLENICYGLHGKQWTKTTRTQRAHELMETMEIQHLMLQYPAALSGGQQQRVALARALAPSPDVLLLDEPLSALDAQIRDTLGQELLHIQRTTQVTAIMVTHDQTEALGLADQIILMNNGSVEQAGTPEELYDRPVSRFAAEFIGHMNVLSLPGFAAQQSIGLRYEDVQVHLPSEDILALPHTFVGKIVHKALMGSFYRLEILLNDFCTQLYADVPRPSCHAEFQQSSLVAVTLPQQAWRVWNDA